MASNLEKAQNFAEAGKPEQSIARSLIVIAAALKMMVEDKQPQLKHKEWCDEPIRHKEWCDDPTCP